MVDLPNTLSFLRQGIHEYSNRYDRCTMLTLAWDLVQKNNDRHCRLVSADKLVGKLILIKLSKISQV